MTQKYYMTTKYRNENVIVERHAWHATKEENVSNINIHGFNRSYSGAAHGKFYLLFCKPIDYTFYCSKTNSKNIQHQKFNFSYLSSH
jgi:hypothetical protein